MALPGFSERFERCSGLNFPVSSSQGSLPFTLYDQLDSQGNASEYNAQPLLLNFILLSPQAHLKDLQEKKYT